MMRFAIILICLVSIFDVSGQRFSFPDEYAQEDAFNSQFEMNMEIEELKKEPFIAISLGENCFPALHFWEYGIRIRSFPFDWDITPFSALYAILENDFEGFIDLKNLAINQKENTVYNTRYQFKLNHDFDIKDWYDGPNGLTPRDQKSMEKYQRVLAYYHRRIARFYAVFDTGVPIYLFRRVVSANQAIKLNNLLKLKFPQSNFTLVCIQDERWDSPALWKDMPSNIVYYRVPHPIDHRLGQKNNFVGNILKDLKLIKK